MATQINSGFSEDPIKHTEGGEIPDTSSSAQMLRRIQADLPVLYNEIMSVKGLISILAVGLGVGGFFVYKATQKQSSSDLDRQAA